MNWVKIIITGFVGGIATWAYSSLVHGFIMAKTYTKYEVFRQEMSSPLYFILVSVMVALMGTMLFAKSRSAWAEGLKGGVMFGFFLGLVAFFSQFWSPLVFEGFPYHLSWCWGGINLIGWMVFGAVAGLLYKK